MTTDRQDSEALGRRRAQRIREILALQLDAERIEVVDKTWQHRRHEGAQDGLGHFQIVVVSPRFTGISTLARHRMIYGALSELITTDIHALRIQALAPGQSAAPRK